MNVGSLTPKPTSLTTSNTELGSRFIETSCRDKQAICTQCSKHDRSDTVKAKEGVEARAR